jgi:hypothetical protein
MKKRTCKRTCKHLEPILLEGSIQVLDDLTDRYDDMNRKSSILKQELSYMKKNTFVKKETTQAIHKTIRENEIISGNMEKDIINIKKKNDQLKINCVIDKTHKIGTNFKQRIHERFDHMDRIIKESQELLIPKKHTVEQMMDHKILTDVTLNPELDEIEMIECCKFIHKHECIIRLYRGYYGYNVLKWTPSQRNLLVVFIAL